MKVGQRYAETNPGRKRRRNEDSFVRDPPLFAVADGMGGAQAGEVASSLAASAVARTLRPFAVRRMMVIQYVSDIMPPTPALDAGRRST